MVKSDPLRRDARRQLCEQDHEGEKVKGGRARTSTQGRGWPWIGAPPGTGREAGSRVQVGVGICEHQIFAESPVWLGGRDVYSLPPCHLLC